jgi:hypothetical protein
MGPRTTGTLLAILVAAVIAMVAYGVVTEDDPPNLTHHTSIEQKGPAKS